MSKQEDHKLAFQYLNSLRIRIGSSTQTHINAWEIDSIMNTMVELQDDLAYYRAKESKPSSKY